MHTVKKTESHGYVLLKEGIESVCPFRAAVPVPAQNALGQTTIQLLSTPCSTICPHAEFSNLNNLGKVYMITCSGSPIEIDVDQDLELKLIN
jgi:hypothetical protein